MCPIFLSGAEDEMEEYSIMGPVPTEVDSTEMTMSTSVYKCLPATAFTDSPPRTFPQLQLSGFNCALGSLFQHKYINT